MPLSAPSRPVVALWALAVLTSAIVAVATAQGIGITPDSVSYVRLAEAFSTSGDLHSPGSWVTSTHFPPGWSLLVGAVSWSTGMSVIGASRLLQVAVAGLLVVVAGRAMAVPGRPIGWLAVAAAAWFGLLYSLYSTSINALTEPLFVLACAGALLMLDRFAMFPVRRHLAAAVALIAATTLIRYVGIALIVPLVWSIARWPVTTRRRWTTLAWALLAAVAPVGLWVVTAPASDASAIHSASTGTGGVDEALRSVEQLAIAVAQSPDTIDRPFFATLVTLVVVVMLAIVVRAMTDRSVDRAELAFRRTVILPWASFGVAYIVLVSAQRWWIDREVISRYWIPVALVIGVVVIRTVALIEPAPLRTIRIVTVLLVVSTVWNVDRIVRRTDAVTEIGIGLNRVRYDDSEVVQTLRDLGELPVLTDSPAAVGFHAPSTRPRDLLLDRVHDRDCRTFDVRAITGLTAPAAVALVASCDSVEIRELVDARSPGATIISEPRIGTVFIWSAAPPSGKPTNEGP